jgi:hypothetical protein
MNLDSVETTILTALGSAPAVNKETVRDFVTSLAPAMGFSAATDHDALCRRLEAKLSIRLELGHVICRPYQPWLDARKATITPFYWDRYVQFLRGKGYAPRVLLRLDEITDRTLGLLEDPAREGEWDRRGLVVGHVQSGKTANYIGLINKAADAGYKLIILIAGTLNNLRRQTQIRVDEGFVGKHSSFTLRTPAVPRPVGVGLIDQRRFPLVFTSTEKDFSVDAAQRLGLSVNAVSEPIVLVIKKNLKTLENLTRWLREHNTRGGRETIDDVPMLLIDDEADYASINTRRDVDPTTINRQIRALLESFGKRCYIGYTATPYANVFINHETDNEMLGADLFPRDFIVTLEAPSNYVGPEELFGDPRDLDAVKPVADYSAALNLRHKITQQVDSLPESLLKAVRIFVLARAIRLCRGQENRHNSMLVNVSRFTGVQSQVRDLIAAYLKQLQDSVRYNYLLPWPAASRNSDMATLEATWRDEFTDAGPAWTDVLCRLHDAVAPIKPVEVNSNQSAAELDYEKHSEKGLNVIAIGGLSLSRGLTLEGLSVSYVLRNSQMYDTLLQMGRWFGYRDGYADLTRVYLPAEAIAWYTHITTATSELRREFERMETQGLTPSDFGLKVRSDPETLLITARNKMREAREIVWRVDLSGKLIETAKITDASTTIDRNRDALEELVAQLDSAAPGTQKGPTGQVVWTGVPRATVIRFLNEFEGHPAHIPSQRAPIIDYCSETTVPGMSEWDVVLASNTQSDAAPATVGGYHIGLQKRGTTRDEVTPPALLVSGSSARVASRGLEKVGVDPTAAKNAEDLYRANNPGKKSIPDIVYREVRERPLLMLHLFRLEIGKDGNVDRVIDNVAAWGISFPILKGGAARPDVTYRVNLVWWNEQHGPLLEEEEEQEDADAAG